MYYINSFVDESKFCSLSESSALIGSPTLLIPEINTSLQETFTHSICHSKKWLLSHHYALANRSLFHNTSNEVYRYHLRECILAQPFSELIINSKIIWESFHSKTAFKTYLFNQVDSVFKLVHSSSTSDHSHLEFPVYILPTRWYQSNYYHWVVECIPRIYYFFELKREFPNLKLAIQPFHVNSYQAQWLRLLNISSHDCYLISPHTNHLFRNAFYVPILGNGHVNQPSIHCLQELLADTYSSSEATPQPSTDIFIDRKPGSVRSFTNYSEVHRFVKNRNYRIIYSEDLSVLDQLLLFRNAHRIIGIHGSGLSNLIISNSCGGVLELMTADMVNPCFYDLASALNINYGFIASPYSGNRVNQHMELNIPLLDESIHLMQ